MMDNGQLMRGMRLRPILFCFSGPTASGKSTICRQLVQRLPDLSLSISTTTRSARPGEQDGVDYFFVSESEFESRVEKGQFIEHALFNKHRYGTEFTNIEMAAKNGHDLLLDIEVQGVQLLKNRFANDVVTSFVFPQSFSTLETRVRARGAETEQQIAERLAIARSEIKVLMNPKFSDYLLINDDLEQAVEHAISVIQSERLRLSRVSSSFISELVK